MELWEADELITLARRGKLKFTIGYSQRFNPKFAYAKKKITDGTLGKVVSVMVSRHLSRGLGTKIAKRVKLSPVVMESTHDLDFVFWLLEPAKPVRVYSQGAYGYMQPINGSYDVMWSIVTMDNGMLVTIGGGWNLPPGYPNFCSTWVEITGTEGALILDDTHRDAWLNTVADGTRFPMSTMPGEQVDHVFAGQMGPETIHFLEACIMDRPVMVTPESARMVMETYTAADLSAERNEPVDLPLSNEALSRGRRNGGRQAMRRQAKEHRARHHRRRPRRAVPRRGRGAPSGGGVDRHRREEPQPRALRRGEDRRRFRHRRTIASCSSARRSPAPSSPPTSICTSIRSWRRSSAACRC